MYRWERPPVPVDYLDQGPLLIQISSVEIADTWNRKHNDALRVFGVTREGYSVAALVSPVHPYFYVEVPANWGGGDPVAYLNGHIDPPPPPPDDEDVMVRVAADGDVRVKRRRDGNTRWKERTASSIIRVDRVQGNSIRGYHEPGTSSAFWRLVFYNVDAAKSARSWFKNQDKAVVYEAGLDLGMQWMIDRGLAGGAWVELNGCRLVAEGNRRTTCQIEVGVGETPRLRTDVPQVWGSSSFARYLLTHPLPNPRTRRFVSAPSTSNAPPDPGCSQTRRKTRSS